jgi:hypothetical protein
MPLSNVMAELVPMTGPGYAALVDANAEFSRDVRWEGTVRPIEEQFHHIE